MYKNEELIKIKIKEITKEEKESYSKNGFLIFDNILPEKEQIEKLVNRAKDCFYYKGDKGISSDECTWKPKLSLDDTPRGLANSWKTDSVMAQLILNSEIGKLACEFLECDSVRVGHDDIFWKPINSKPIGMHQDLPYLNAFLPREVVTVWIALTDVSKENGTLEFIPGSHKWVELNSDENKGNENNEFFAPDDYLKSIVPVMNKQGIKSIEELDVKYVTVKKGGASIHHGKLWHGSNSNPSSINERIGITIHLIPANSEFNPNTKPINSFGRYKLYGSNKLEESFYPITYSKNGYKSPNIIQAMSSSS